MLYAAYGSNINLSQMEYRCPNSSVIGTGMIHGYRLVFKYHADIIQDVQSSVPVLVWDTPEDDVEMLDLYEGYPNYYMTIPVDVDMDDGTTVCAFAYVMNEKYDTIERPDKMYYRCIEEGYVDNGMDLSYLCNAMEEAYYETIK